MATPLINARAASRAKALSNQHALDKAQVEERIKQLEDELASCNARLKDLQEEDEFYEQIVDPVVGRFVEIHGTDPGRVK
jgi:predicted ribosome quality control (RQC) complex YloA/Tae2 family protein